MRVAVIGLGGVGVHAARFLSRAGCRVVGFEQFRLNHDRGSSYGASRIIRRVYPQSDYARLMDLAYPLWAELESECGQRLLHRCGGLYFGPRGHAEMTDTEASLREVGVRHDVLDAAEASRRVPALRLRKDEYALFEADSGYLHASACVLAGAESARRAGAELREETRVHSVEPRADGVWIRFSAGRERFDAAVVAAGPWAERLLRDHVSLPLTVHRQQYAHFDPGAHQALFQPDRFPVWIDMDRQFYGFPHTPPVAGVKAAHHCPGPLIDPDSPERECAEAAETLLREYLAERLPLLAAGEILYRKVCLYTMSPDSDFIVDRLPDEPRVALVAGLSGHGFKFTAMLGLLAAELARGASETPIPERFALSRFARQTGPDSGS